jgi:hypothetical protein
MLNIKEFTIECLNCQNKGFLIDSDKFELNGKYNGYPTLVCKQCSKLSIYKVPIKYYLTKLGAILFMLVGIYVATIGTSPIAVLCLFLFASLIIYSFGYKKEIEIIQVIDVPEAMKTHLEHFKKDFNE